MTILHPMTIKTNTIYLVDALRTPTGKLYGALSHLRPDDLGVSLTKGLLQKQAIDPQTIDGIFIGCANQAGEDNRNIARMIGLLAQLPTRSNAITLNSLCSSGLESILMAARRLALGEGACYLAGGLESMSRSPWVSNRTKTETVDSTIGWRFVNPTMADLYPPLSMTETAEILASEQQISRQAQDQYAHQSRLKYQAALEKNWWETEILPLTDSRQRKWKTDEQHRLLSLDLLAKLPTLVKNGQYISSGNAARIGDGAALVLVATEAYVKRHQLEPLARLEAWTSAACHPTQMSLSAALAAQQLLRNTKIPASAIDWLEMSETFAVQALACIQQLGIDPQKVNPNGGALTMGNPIGAGAARLVASLAHALKKTPQLRYGLAATSAGLGTGAALLLQPA